jgi:flagellar biosynthetic protein FliR
MEVYVPQLILYLLLLARVTSMIVLAPVFGHMAIPLQVKVAMGLFVSFVLFPMVSAMGPKVDVPLLALVVMVLQEIAVGALIGFASGMLFAGLRYAGEIISLHMGLSFANILDPDTNQNNPVVGQFLYLTTILIFLTINGHHFLIEAVYLSYSGVPIGSFTFAQPVAQELIRMVGMVFVVGVKFAAPVLVAIFLNNIAMGILARVMPQMNIFSISFSLNIGVGLLVLMTTSPLVVYVFKKALAGFEQNVLEIIRLM